MPPEVKTWKSAVSCLANGGAVGPQSVSQGEDSTTAGEFACSVSTLADAEPVLPPRDSIYSDGGYVVLSSGDTLPASFDLRTEGRVSPVRNQSTCGCCWAFGVYGSLESTMLPSQAVDYSENSLKNASWFDKSYGANAGNADIAMAYLVRWSGPVAEADDPYDPKSTTSAPGLLPAAHVQNVMFIPARDDALETADIKHTIVEFGAVSGVIDWEGDQYGKTFYYDPSSGGYYNSNGGTANHAVTIVGWDDSFPSTNFSTRPSGDGAWIVKNSWGTDWGKNGYFFVSYYDATLFKKGLSYCFLAAEPVTNYAHIYQYDPFGYTGFIGYGGTTAWAANVFTATATERVNAVGFYALDASTSYVVSIYGAWNGTSFSKLLSTTSGKTDWEGYHTIVLPNSGARVTIGQAFGVVIKVMSSSNKFPIATERPVSQYSNMATAQAGQSYISPDGTSWQDIAETESNTNVCIKAYAGAPLPPVTLSCQASPSSMGSITVSPQSADGTYAVDTEITITAAPAPGCTFTGWSGGATGTTNPMKITMDDAHTITAMFAPITYTLNILVHGMGSITQTPLAPQYSAGASVQLIATPTEGWVFTGWEGLAPGTGNPATVVMDSSIYAIARFERIPVTDHIVSVTIGSLMMVVDGRDATLDSPAVIKNGRTLVPIRAIIEALGGTVGWDGAARKATVTLGDTTLELWIGKSAATVNGTTISIDTTNAKVVPEIINGRTMLPLRFVTENLGATVGWADATKTITIAYTP